MKSISSPGNCFIIVHEQRRFRRASCRAAVSAGRAGHRADRKRIHAIERRHQTDGAGILGAPQQSLLARRRIPAANATDAVVAVAEHVDRRIGTIEHQRHEALMLLALVVQQLPVAARRVAIPDFAHLVVVHAVGETNARRCDPRENLRRATATWSPASSCRRAHRSCTPREMHVQACSAEWSGPFQRIACDQCVRGSSRSGAIRSPDAVLGGLSA